MKKIIKEFLCLIGIRKREVKKENLEIERKFLLKNVPKFSSGEFKKLIIHQIYVDFGGKINRYRMSEDVDNSTTIYHSCVKKSISHGVFEEIEKEISKIEFELMLDEDHRSIIKTRYVYKQGDLKWEIDSYHDMKLVTLEVELEDINQKIKIPNIINEQLIVEVTGQKEFSNYSLSKKCF